MACALEVPRFVGATVLIIRAKDVGRKGRPEFVSGLVVGAYCQFRGTAECCGDSRADAHAELNPATDFEFDIDSLECPIDKFLGNPHGRCDGVLFLQCHDALHDFQLPFGQAECDAEVGPDFGGEKGAGERSVDLGGRRFGNNGGSRECGCH